MTDLDLDAIEAAHDRTCTFCGNGATCTNAALVAALREARAEVERLRGPFPCCEHCVEYPDDDPHLDGVKDQHDLPCQICESWRDDWRRRYEALRDGVTALCDDHDACDDPNCRDLIHGFRAVVARVEGDES